MNYDPNKPHRIDDLEKKLYSARPDITIKERKPIYSKDYEVPEDWEKTAVSVEDTELSIPQGGPNWFFRFFVLAFIFFLGAAGFAAYMFFVAPQSLSKNIDISINAPLSVGAGEPFEFEVLIKNEDSVPIIDADIEVQFPDGTRALGDIGTMYQTDRQRIERVEPGTIVKKNYSAVLFGEENDKKDIKVFLTYQTEDSTAFFEKEKEFDTILKSTPIRLTVSNVTETTSGQDVKFTIELVSNSTQVLRNIVLDASLPFGFMLKDSTIPPRDDKKSWLIPMLNPKESYTLTLTGKLDGQQGDDKFFRFVAGLETSNTTSPLVVFNTKDTIIQIKRPFLELELDIDKKSDPIIVLDPIRNNNANITFKNNTDSPIRNAEISLVIKGDSLRKDSVQVNQGFYQSLTNTIKWDNSTISKLAMIPVGGSETLSFNFSGLGLANQSFIVNPELAFAIQVKGNRNPESRVIDTLEDTITRTVRFNTEASIQTRSEYYSSVFANSGPIPPEAETKTTYTGVLQVFNTSNEVQDATVTFRVPNYVQYEGVYSPSTENVSYDPITRIATWRIGTLPVKTGYQGNQPKRLYLQASIIPSVSQTGLSPEIFNAITLTGKDSFTGSEISKTGSNITTSISDSKGFYDGRVTR